MSKEDEILYLVDFSHIVYNKSSLKAKNVECVKYELSPILNDITIEDIRKIGKSYIPPDWNDDIDKIKKKYNEIIEVINKYDAIFLKFEEEKYFSLFNVKNVKSIAYAETQFTPFTFIFPFKLYLEFKILTENNVLRKCNITIIYNEFFDTYIIREKEVSETLALRSEFGLNYIGNDEIIFK